MGTLDVGAVVGLVLSAGAGAFVTALVAGINDLRRGAGAGRREVVRDLMAWRDDLDEARKCAQADVDFWRDLAGERGGQLRDRGIVPANPYPVAPSQLPGARHRGNPAVERRRRARRAEMEQEDQQDDEPG